jgi:hypothetical protein
MLVGRTSKETTDRHRVVIDWLRWLDPGEGLTAVSDPVVVVDNGAWVESAPPVQTPPEDTTPLTVFSMTMLDTNTKVQFLLDAGTPSLVYLVSIMATGGASGRIQTVEFRVHIEPAP